jgi:cytochrome c biogenesis protein ResB
MLPQHFATENPHRTWKISMRPERHYFPFAFTLLKFSHDIYPGTDIPKNFSSRVKITDNQGGGARESLIYMNNPLRFGGFTFFQKSFANEDRTSVLQVVRNPSWRLPYIACSMMALGLVIQFLLHLTQFARRQRKNPLAAA